MILVRHGQSHFNVVFGATRRDPGYVDPGLTVRGRGEAQNAARDLAGRGFRHVLSSPYRRALETAHVIAELLGLPHEVDPLVGERAVFACDIGTPASALSAHWRHLDLDHLPEVWWPPRQESEQALMDRCRRFHRRMQDTASGRHTVVVSHWGFIRALTGEEVHNGALVPFDLGRPRDA